MSDVVRSRPSRALVIGGSIAGMLAAAAVRDHVDRVEIIEAHELPDGPEPRVGVPQARHIHFLQTGGAEAVEALLPGTVGRLVAAGAYRIPETTRMLIYSPEGWYRRWRRSTHYLITATRDLIDSVVRAQVRKDARVGVRSRSQVTGLLGGPDGITGVRIRHHDGEESEEFADLVVDASGRASRTPHWLAALGITGLAEERIDSGLAYASRLYRAPVDLRDWPVIGVQADPAGPFPGNAGGILPVEGNRWHVSLMGAPGGQPTHDPADFERFAGTLRHPIVARLIERAEPLTGVSVTHSTANRRYRYERLKPWPRGLVVLGDAAAACNPLYGHGMSVAAQSALALRDTLSADGQRRDVHARAQRAIARCIDTAWALSVGQDIHFSTTVGARPTLVDHILRRYVSRLSRTATGSFHAATALTDVLALQAPATSLLRPSVLLTALTGPLRPPLQRPPLGPPERSVLKDWDQRGPQ
ncbi:NAD(P)-binding protein [Streptomyces thermospinosisporus]|uniref:NAD(P)-binding protein n=1 Tax=Streptomyces thermospinosisporus TaxID=161482 RepID=A0ABP4JN92_9ACTN